MLALPGRDSGLRLWPSSARDTRSASQEACTGLGLAARALGVREVRDDLAIESAEQRGKKEASRPSKSACAGTTLTIYVRLGQISLEKRLGLAQLFALVVLLFFVILTRGSPSTPFLALSPSASSRVISPAFPTRTPRHRPQSLHELLPDSLPFSRPSNREIFARERRSHGPDRRVKDVYANAGLSRSNSGKRPMRTSGNLRRPWLSPPNPTGTTPIRSHSDAGLPQQVERSLTPTPATAPVRPNGTAQYDDEPQIRSASHTSNRSRGALDMPSLATALLSSTGLPSPRLGNRSSPVDSIRRRLRLSSNSPRQVPASLTSAPPTVEGLPDTPPPTSTAQSPNKRRMFSLGFRRRPSSDGVTRHRQRRDTLQSADDESGKAWTSTSEEDSEDEPYDHDEDEGDAITTNSQVHNRSDRQLRPYLPSPEPSDAEPAETAQLPSLPRSL